MYKINTIYKTMRFKFLIMYKMHKLQIRFRALVDCSYFFTKINTFLKKMKALVLIKLFLKMRKLEQKYTNWTCKIHVNFLSEPRTYN